MAEFRHQDLSGSTFEVVDLSRARFKNVVLSDAVLRGVWGEKVEIDGDFESLTFNGIDLIPLWHAEMLRLHPEYAQLTPTDADGYRAAWPMLEHRWEETVARARRLPEELLHERVDGEWSFIETQRHLVMATDAWIRRAVLGDPRPFHPLGLPHDEMGEIEGVPNDPDARPTLDEVLAVRADRMGTYRQVVAELTDEQLAGTTTPVLEPGYPASEAFAVSRCLQCILSEEWWHRCFAERDLAVLEARLEDSTG
jgi:DinB superfamily/Pentapeptide repeats (8 copies)